MHRSLGFPRWLSGKRIHLPMQEMQVWPSCVRRIPLEEEMATHSSILAWRIPWTEEHGRLQPMGSQRVRHDWVTEHGRMPRSLFLAFLSWCLCLSDGDLDSVQQGSSPDIRRMSLKQWKPVRTSDLLRVCVVPDLGASWLSNLSCLWGCFLLLWVWSLVWLSGSAEADGLEQHLPLRGQQACSLLAPLRALRGRHLLTPQAGCWWSWGMRLEHSRSLTTHC